MKTRREKNHKAMLRKKERAKVRRAAFLAAKQARLDVENLKRMGRTSPVVLEGECIIGRARPAGTGYSIVDSTAAGAGR